MGGVGAGKKNTVLSDSRTREPVALTVILNKIFQYNRLFCFGVIMTENGATDRWTNHDALMHSYVDA